LKRAVLLFFLAGCGVDATGLTATTAADDGGAELAAPAAHPDADTEAPAAATDTAGEIAAPTPTRIRTHRLKRRQQIRVSAPRH